MKRLTVLFVLLMLMGGHALWGERLLLTGKQMDVFDEGKTVIVEGDVVLVHGVNTLKADWMKSEDNQSRVEAKHRVRFWSVSKEGHPIDGEGRRAVYERASGRCSLWGDPAVVHARDAKDKTSQVTMKAAHIVREGEKVFLNRHADHKIRPHVLYASSDGDGEYEADEIEMDRATRRMVAVGQVKGWFLLR